MENQVYSTPPITLGTLIFTIQWRKSQRTIANKNRVRAFRNDKGIKTVK